MAQFEIAFKITGGNEGGYANNKADHGGETYAGISRNNWPKWEGWKIIDKIKTGRTPKEIDSALFIGAAPIHFMVQQFYKTNFWDTNRLSEIDDQQIANNVYDMGVNNGTHFAAVTLQRAVGVNADGKIGNVTIAAVNRGNPETIYTNINTYRKAKYLALAVGNQSQFLHSWLSRLVPYSL